MNDEVSLGLAMNRRDLLKRGAIVGGTLVWAAPAVQTIMPRAFASDGSPLSGFSYAAFIVRCVDGTGAGSSYRVKGNLDEDTGEFVFETSPGALPSCDSGHFASFAEAWEAASKTGGMGVLFTVTYAQSGSLVTFQVSDLSNQTCEVQIDTVGGIFGVIKESTNCAPQVSVSETQITFDESQTDAKP